MKWLAVGIVWMVSLFALGVVWGDSCDGATTAFEVMAVAVALGAGITVGVLIPTEELWLPLGAGVAVAAVAFALIWVVRILDFVDECTA